MDQKGSERVPTLESSGVRKTSVDCPALPLRPSPYTVNIHSKCRQENYRETTLRSAYNAFQQPAGLRGLLSYCRWTDQGTKAPSAEITPQSHS